MSKAQELARAREYETIYVMRPDVNPESAQKIAGRVEELVGREKGRLTLVETWGRRQLAYPVAKYKRGVYVYLRYVGGGGVVNELERNLRMLDDVLKYQTVQTRAEIDASTLEVNPENVKFEAIEPPGEDEVEESRERALGLEEVVGDRPPRSDDFRDRDDDDDDEEGIGDEDEDEEPVL
jgi:small subunit ribosomal protein S6